MTNAFMVFKYTGKMASEVNITPVMTGQQSLFAALQLFHRRRAFCFSYMVAVSICKECRKSPNPPFSCTNVISSIDVFQIQPETNLLRIFV